jgi:hypothetical protein
MIGYLLGLGTGAALTLALVYLARVAITFERRSASVLFTSSDRRSANQFRP